MDSERVDAAFELTDKCCVDHAVALEPALPAEHLRHNIHPEMSLPALPMPGMSRVLVGFVHHVEPYGGESLGQLLRDEIAPCHGVRSPTRRSMPATARKRANCSSRSRRKPRQACASRCLQVTTSARTRSPRRCTPTTSLTRLSG